MRHRWTVPLGLLALVALSASVRTSHFDVGFWIDEGLSVGIADRPLTDIPGVLRRDGSPPLYYLLLHLWMRLLGDTSEAATHGLSLLFGLAAIPVGWYLARRLFGDRAGWVAAVLLALNPFLNTYAQETRMYALVVLLGVVTVSAFVGAFVQRRGRGWIAAFAVAMVAMFYTHNWALFLAASAALAGLVLVVLAPPDERRGLVRDGLLATGGVLVLYAPWIPSFLFQAAHTGAPWATAPDFEVLRYAPERLLGEVAQAVLVLGAGAGVAGLLWRRPRTWSADGRTAVALAVLAIGTMVLAWVASQLEPAWATRYLAAAVAPLLLLVALGLSRAGPVGLGALAIVAVLWVGERGPAEKSNVRDVAEWLAPALREGDLVISTQPEQAPVLHYYLDDVPGLRWASITGELTDLGVTDWRDGEKRLEATSPQRHLAPLLDRLAPGARVALVQPDIYSLDRWRAPWTSLVRRRSTAWEEWMMAEPRFRVVADHRSEPGEFHPNALRATVFVRGAMR